MLEPVDLLGLLERFDTGSMPVEIVRDLPQTDSVALAAAVAAITGQDFGLELSGNRLILPEPTALAGISRVPESPPPR